jgi:hypothetical protein
MGAAVRAAILRGPRLGAAGRREGAQGGPAGADRVDDVRGPMAEEQAAPAVPLDLAPLLALYKRHAHLSLKIERLPDRARLSKGHNNADSTWSLTPNDLEGLCYLPAPGRLKPHNLALRILNLDDDSGATLAVIDLPIVPESNAADAADNAPAILTEGALRRMKEDHAATAKKLAAAERELAEAQAKLESQQHDANAQRAADIDAVRKDVAATVQRRLETLAAESAAKLTEARAQWQAEEGERRAKAEAQEHERAAQARLKAVQESEAALTKARASWKAEEDQRLAAAEAQWRQQAARAVTQATTRAEQAEAALSAARAEVTSVRGDDEAVLRRLREEVAALEAKLAAREAELTRAKDALGDAQRFTQRGGEVAMAAARAQWQDEEARRLEKLEAQWRAQAEKGTEEVRARFARVEKDMAEAASRGARAESALAEEKARAAKLEAALAEEKSRSGRAEAAMADAKAQAERAEAALISARNEAKAIQARDEAAAIKALREERAALEARLKSRDSEILRVQAAAEAARHEGAAALVASREKWQAEEKQRLVKAEAQWRAEGEKDLTDARARFTKAETDLAHAKMHNERLETALGEAKARVERNHAGEAAARAGSKPAAPAPAQADDGTLARLRDDLASMQARLASRDAELARLRNAEERARGQIGSEIETALRRAEEDWKAGEAQRLRDAETRWREQAKRDVDTARRGAADAELKQLRERVPALEEKLKAREDALTAREEELAAARAAAAIPGASDAEAIKAAVDKALFTARQNWEVEEAMRLVEARAEWQKKEEQSKTHARGLLATSLERQRKGRLARRVAVAAAVLAAIAGAIFYYPRLQSTVAQDVKPELADLAHDAAKEAAPAPRVEPTRAEQPVQAARTEKAQAPPPQHRWVIAAASAKVRDGPSPGAGVIATLAHDVEVTPIDRRGSWMLIRFGEGIQHRQEGWVSESLVKDVRPH